MTWQQEQDTVKEVITSFPETFGLRAFPGDVFRVSEGSSYYSQTYGVMVYTERKLEDGRWVDFCKGTPGELRREMVKL